MKEERKPLDLLGLQPIAKSVEILTEGAVDGAAAFLSRICLPAAEEFGLLLRDRVRDWRTKNIVAITTKAEQKLLEFAVPANVHAHPRLVHQILEEGSWIEDELVQEMWAGLLASACTESGVDDSNIIFTNLLSELTSIEAKILNYLCEHAEKCRSANNLVFARELAITFDTLRDFTGEQDLYRLDRELDHLSSLDLTRGGFFTSDPTITARIVPAPLALQLIVRAKGARTTPLEFFGLTDATPQSD